MVDSLDYEIYEIRNLSDMQKPTMVSMRIFGCIDSDDITEGRMVLVC